MRLAWAIALFLSCAACDDTSIRVVFKPPPSVSLQQLVLRYVEPPAVAPFGCDELAFGAVDERTLQLSIRQTLALDVASKQPDPLSQLSRTAQKLFWVSGLDSQGETVTEGCAELGAISGPREVIVQGEPSVRVTALTSSLLIVGDAGTRDVELLTSSIDGGPLDAIAVRWKLVAVLDGGTSGTGKSAAGRLTISPQLPSAFGPFSVQTGVRWAIGPAHVTPGLFLPEPSVTTIPASVTAPVAAKFGAQPTVAVLTRASPIKTLLTLYTWDGTRTLKSESIDAGPSRVMVAVPEPTPRLILLGGLLSGSWSELAGTKLVERDPSLPGEVVTEALAIRAPGLDCATSGPMISATLEMKQPSPLLPTYRRQSFWLDGRSASHPVDANDAGLLEGGCVTTTSGGSLPICVLKSPQSTTSRLFVYDGTTVQNTGWPGIPSGTKALPPDENGVRHFAGGRAVTEGYALSIATIEFDGGIKFHTMRSIPLKDYLLQTVPIDLDGNGTQDIAALTTDLVGNQSLVLWVDATPTPLAATMPLGTNCLASILAVDIGSDGRDDLVVAVRCLNSTELRVFDLKHP